MPSYNKSFNFRNGVQVDDDNFIVNANGLVGIGTSIPREFLDVHGTAKITGLVTARNLAVTGVSTFYSDVKIGSGIAFYASTGIISATAFYGDGRNLLNVEQVAVDGWIVNTGNISTTSKVGIGTTLPRSQLDVVGGVTVSGIVTALGFGGYQVLVGTESSSTKNFKVKVAPKTSNHRYTGSGSANAYLIDGKESPFLTLLPGKTYIFDQSDASNIDNRLSFYLEADRTTPYDTNVTTSLEGPGTPNSRTEIIVTDTTPVILHYQSLSSAYMGNAAQFNSNIVNTPYQITTLAGISATTGVVTAYSFSGFGTNIQGINATNITNGTLSNSRLPQSISITGILTASSGIITSLTSTNLNNTGIATLGIVTASQLYVSGVTTSLQGFVGNVTGIASTALSLSGTPNISVANINSSNINNTGIATLGNITSSNINNTGIATLGNITSSNINNTGIITSLFSSIGVSTVSTRLYAERIGVGTNFPLSDIHIRKIVQSRLQVTSDTAEAIIAIGRSTTLNQNNGALIFGTTSGLYPYSNSKTLDIVNYDTGSLNHYLHYGISGVGTGNFNWIYGQNANNPLMSLTYQGNLGIGITNPTNKLQVSGDISASSLSLSGNITATGNIGATGAGTSVSANILYVYGGKSQILNIDGTQIFPSVGVSDNLNITSGVSTFYDIEVTNLGIFNEKIGIGNTNPQGELHIGVSSDSILITSGGIGIGTDDIISAGAFLYSPNYSAIFSNIGIGTTSILNDDETSENIIKNNLSLYVIGNSEFDGNLGIGTTNPTSKLTVVGNSEFDGDVSVSSIVTATQFVGSLTGNATTANYATNAGIATYADYAGIATYSTNSGVSTSVIGGIGSITQLQVTGDAYVSGNLGIGITNPKGVLDLVSTTQPLYLPRMTTAQRNLIVGISSGAVIFNTSVNEFQGYTGTAWVTF